MNMLETFWVALDSLNRNKMRSILTMLGIIIGVGAVIAMVAIGQGAQHNIEEQIQALGTNVLIVYPGAQNVGGVRFAAGSQPTLTAEDADAVREDCPAVAYIAPGVRTGGRAVYGNMNWGTGMQGTTPVYVEIRQWPVESGRFFTDSEVRAAARVCLLGQTVAKNLFEDQDPVGKIIRYRDAPWRVIGVMSPKGQNALGQDQDDMMLAPYTTVQKKVWRITYVHMILVSAVSQAMIPEAQRQISDLLRMRHKLPPWEEDDFTVRTQNDLASAATATSKVLTILLASIASVSLVVGGIGIMNIMLVSVTERTREIGIRMSMGARSRDILYQFIIEAMVLSVIGGIIGIVFGVVSSGVVSTVAGWPTLVSPGAIFLAFAFSAAVGIFFGFYPARKAALLNPIDALRYE